ncbi:hypothetical protein CHS0354_020447 [Potamilus streckersoni]|uniref:Mitochondria-eating protein n=1 Tax=Potamilus streckersoni TaxID=2493646 RepID=A0AAE0WB26_9BIVA|nr:hypothetical protein CHS0354_020447 [Potamilus streckersoni]
MFIENILKRNWIEANYIRQRASNECKVLMIFLAMHGLKSEHDENQGKISKQSLQSNTENAEPMRKNNKTMKNDSAHISAENANRPTGKKRTESYYNHQITKITDASGKNGSNVLIEAKRKGAHDSDEIIRRSEEASLLLLQGNPNIADLADNNRPTKLAERFSELYSNEYTEAFEELERKQIREQDIIQILLNIVTNAYIYCQNKASEEYICLKVQVKGDFRQKGYSSDKVEAFWRGHAAKLLKERGLKMKTNICENFIREELHKSLPPPLNKLGKKLSAFVSSSVEIVWFMSIQDPPLCLQWIEDKDNQTEFDTDKYRFYTTSGKYVEYCVWPLLLLYDKGPILAKGIAQGI